MLLKIDNLSYQIGDKIIKDVSFSLGKGEEITIVGPSGIGKSTLLKILSKFVVKNSGEIYFEGKNIEEIDDSKYRKQVSYCIQNPTLFENTVKDNLLFPFTILDKEVDYKEINKLLVQLNLPIDIIDKPIGQLSGGERQRIAIIRNLLMKPKVLLLDEVSDGLDEEAKVLLRELLNNLLKEDVGIISVTHDTDFINPNSKIIELN